MDNFLTDYQLRVARGVLKLGVRDIGNILQLSRTTVSKLESGKVLFQNLKFSIRRSSLLIEFFKSNNIIFPDHTSIELIPSSIAKLKYSNIDNMLTAFHIKGGKCILNITRNELSQKINISNTILSRIEKLPNESPLNLKDDLINEQIRTFFNKEKITFPTSFSIKYS